MRTRFRRMDVAVSLGVVMLNLFVRLFVQFGDGGAETECTKGSWTYKQLVVEMIIQLLFLK
jgi:hypothetical protein